MKQLEFIVSMGILLIVHSGQYEKAVKNQFSLFLSHTSAILVIIILTRTLISTWKLIRTVEIACRILRVFQTHILEIINTESRFHKCVNLLAIELRYSYIIYMSMCRIYMKGLFLYGVTRLAFEVKSIYEGFQHIDEADVFIK